MGKRVKTEEARKTTTKKYKLILSEPKEEIYQYDNKIIRNYNNNQELGYNKISTTIQQKKSEESKSMDALLETYNIPNTHSIPN